MKILNTQIRGKKRKCIPDYAPCPKNSRMVAGWHTHGNFDNNYYSEYFSSEDVQWVNNSLHPSQFYLITPSDRVHCIIRTTAINNETGKMEDIVIPCETSFWDKWNKEHPKNKKYPK